MIRVVVFDFDGTLVDSNAIKLRCFNEVVASLPVGLGVLTEARLAGGTRYQIFETIARHVHPEREREAVATLSRRLVAEYSKRCLKGIIAAPERRGASAALRALKRRGLKIWINSATPKINLPAILRGRRLCGLIDGVMGGPHSKVDNLRQILVLERATPREVMLVGDGLDDYAAAIAMRTWFVAVTAENEFENAAALQSA